MAEAKAPPDGGGFQFDTRINNRTGLLSRRAKAGKQVCKRVAGMFRVREAMSL